MKLASPTKLRAIAKTEKNLIGYYDYLARYTYFHAYKYRHTLRDVSYPMYLRVYRALLKAGLDPTGETKAHDTIINKITGSKY